MLQRQDESSIGQLRRGYSHQLRGGSIKAGACPARSMPPLVRLICRHLDDSLWEIFHSCLPVQAICSEVLILDCCFCCFSFVSASGLQQLGAAGGQAHQGGMTAHLQQQPGGCLLLMLSQSSPSVLSDVDIDHMPMATSVWMLCLGKILPLMLPTCHVPPSSRKSVGVQEPQGKV